MSMVVGILSVEISLEGCLSLKDKRQVVRSLIGRVKSRFNASVAEVDLMNRHQRGVIGAALVSNDRRHMDAQIDHLLNFIEADGRFSVVSVQRELY